MTTATKNGLLLLAVLLLGTATGPTDALQRGHSFTVPTIDHPTNEGGDHDGLVEPTDEELLAPAADDYADAELGSAAQQEQQRLSTLQGAGAVAAGGSRRRRRGKGSSSFAKKVQGVLKKIAAQVKAHEAELEAFRKEIDAKMGAAKEAVAAKKDEVAEAVRAAAAEVAKAQEETIQKMVMQAIDEHHAAAHEAERAEHERQMRKLFESSVAAVRAKMDQFEKELAGLKATFVAHAGAADAHHVHDHEHDHDRGHGQG